MDEKYLDIDLRNENEQLKKQLKELEIEKNILSEKLILSQKECDKTNELLNQEKKIIESLPVGAVIYNVNGKVIYYNKCFVKLFGYTIKDLSDVEGWFSEVYPDVLYRDEITKKWFNAIENYNQTGIFPYFEARIKCKDGTYKIIDLGFESFGEILLTTFFDITERKLAQEAKNTSEWRYKIISDLITDYIFVVDIENDGSLNFKWASENLERLTGRKQDEVGNLSNWMKIIHPDYIQQFKDYIREVIINDQSLETECKSIIKDGRERWINIYAKKHINIQTGRPSIIGAVKDITLRKNAEIAIKESEEKYRNLIDNVNEVIYIHNKEGIFTYVSPQVESIFGYKVDEVLGFAWQEVSTEHPVNIKSWGKILRHYDAKSKSTMTNIYEVRSKVGKLMFLEATERILYDKSDNILGVIGSARDITKRKMVEDELKKHRNRLEILVNERTEELQVTNEELRSVNEELYFTNEKLENQKEELKNTLKQLKEAQSHLIQTEKMASLGILTAGVAHEINNPLNFIQAGIYKLEEIKEVYASQLKNSEIDTLFKDAINYIDIGVKRASDIVKSLTRLSRKSEDIKQPCNIHSIIDSCLLILNYEIKYKCNIEKNYNTEELIIPGIEGKLHQVFLNLLVNAIQAMETGTITINTSMDLKTNTGQIVIIDTGKGIEQESLNKIFDPFYTTKEPGHGTGLGLSIVYSIIQEHNGTIEYKSEINKGTEVYISLPA